MTVTEAARIWIEAKKAERRYKPQKDAAAAVLKAHFAKTGRHAYKGISYGVSTRTVLDTAAVKEELGDKLQKFQTTRSVETLSLLEKK